MSDWSSVISLGDRMGALDTDDDLDMDLQHVDTRKYIIPDTPKAMSALQRTENLDPAHQPPEPFTMTTDMQQTKAEDSASEADVHIPPSSRPASIYSLSRVSLTSQLSQLTSIRLPNAASLSAKIRSMPTSIAAAKALVESAEQIRLWIKNASSVLQGLDAEDDVEWAAASGREGVDELDKAINRFEKVIKVYLLSVEELQLRTDISSLSIEELQINVEHMESIVREWHKIKETLGGVKDQVEVAMEWEELWDSVLGSGVGQELDELARLVFELEEKRHQSVISDAANDPSTAIDIDELKTIVDENPGNRKPPQAPQYSLPPPFSPTLPLPSTSTLGNMEDRLLGLFARMQPLRASLDFLPMRLYIFHCRGNHMFPSACLTLEAKRDSLEEQWRKLEADSEALRRELGEDRWLLVFRNAGRQAMKMCKSVWRSVEKLQAAIDAGEQQKDAAAIARKIESYEAKKTHYGPAIEQVLAIVGRGVLDRLTVNGEILRLQSDMKRQWSNLQASMRTLDSNLVGMNIDMRNQELRDSISTILSSEQSLGSSLFDTPRSSPASSMSGRSSFHNDHTNGRTVRKLWSSSLPRKTPGPSTSGAARSSSASLAHSPSVYTPVPTAPLLRTFKAPSDKPRWNTSTIPVGRDFSPLSATEPSLYRKTTPISQRHATPHSAPSKIPAPSALSRATASPSQSPAATPLSTSHLSNPTTSPLAPRSTSSLANRTISLNFKLRTSSSSSHAPRSSTPVSGRKSSLLASTRYDGADLSAEKSPSTRRITRPPSALATPSGRKSSALVEPWTTQRGGRVSRADGRNISNDSRPSIRF